MLRGELWWANLPMRGSEQKRRPMLVVSDDLFNTNPRYPKVMVVHLTSVKRVAGPFEWEVAVPRGTAGLERHSIVKCAEIYTVWKEQLRDAVGMLPSSVMRKVDRALCLTLGLPFAESEV